MADHMDETRQIIEKATKARELARLALLILEAKGGSAKDAERAASRVADRITVYSTAATVVDASGEESSLEALAIEAGGTPSGKQEQRRAVGSPDPEEVAAAMQRVSYSI